eukprot:TRINITY_DN42315_c0_g1_i1.p1 TRINITY_DN42315_c0_g1~~TRINITY_DN42315_c0_g1_i1.p1  ORF type:complete len:268 (-),score=28.29 TRINITY_DN42315_c0_g1_i1:15-743(-)
MMQANALVEKFRRRPVPDLVFSSCLLRAQETALLAFPEQTVHVAPHIVELSLGLGSIRLPAWIDPGDYWDDGHVQQSVLEKDLGNAALARLSFGGLEPKSCGPADWDLFLAWLWNRSAVQNLLAQGTRPHVAVVSHGNFLAMLLAQHGFSHGHPHNVETFSAVLPFTRSGFGSMTDVEVAFSGFTGADSYAKVIWFLLSVVAILACLCLRVFARRRQGIGRRRAGSGGGEEAVGKESLLHAS